jgi:hypothetical protein
MVAANVLQDIELPPAVADNSLWLFLSSILLLLLLIVLFWFWKQRQQPIAKAIRHLKHLPDTPINPAAIAIILQDDLQIKHLSNSNSLLSKSFVQDLEYARFSAQTCSSAQYLVLKQQALDLLQCDIEKVSQ